MRVLIAYSGHPWLYRSATWKYVRQIAEANPDDYFYIMVSKNAVITDGDIPNAKLVRSKTDTSYFFYRDIGQFVNVNDGQYVVDAALAITPEMACGIDLAVNARGFTPNTHNIPVVIWHHMLHAVKDPRWLEMTALFPSLYCSSDEYRLWSSYLTNRYKPSVVKEVLDKSRSFPFSGKDLVSLRDRAESIEKFTRPSVIFGARFNSWHNPDDAIDILEAVYKLGIDFQPIITTPDRVLDTAYIKRIESIGGELHLECGMDKFHDLLMRSHAGLITGKAAGLAYFPEFLAGGTILVADKPHCVYDEVVALQPPYPYSFSTKDRATSLLAYILRNTDKAYQHFADSDYQGQAVDSMDYRIFGRRALDWMRTLVRPLRYRDTKDGMQGNRARIVMQLASAGGTATLSEMVEVTKVSGTNVADDQAGRWVTRKVIHDILTSNPSVTDVCDGPEPRYVMNHARFKTWMDEHDFNFNGPTQVQRVVGVK